MARNSQGNALFLILIAVALFAALAYAVTQSGKGSGTISKEQAMLDLTKVSDYASSMQHAITRMKLVNGCTDDQISFVGNGGTSKTTNGTAYTYTNTNAPADGSCNVFSPNGGNMPPPDLIPAGLVLSPSAIPGGWMHPQSWVVTATRIVGHGTETGGAGTDIVLWQGRLTKEQCINLNNKFGVTNPAGNPPNDNWDCNALPFDGTFPSCANPIGNVVTSLAGQYDFCVLGNSAAYGYNYMHVIVDR